MPEGAVSLLSELPESSAAGEALRIYGEIKRLAGVPMVALIYRHLATMPGVLEWCWALLEPALRSGALQRRAWELAAQASIADVPRIPRPALRAVGLRRDDERAIGAVLDAYNRANPVNILAVRCIALHLAGAVTPLTAHEPAAGDPATAHEAAAWTPPATPAPLPAIIDPQAMSPAVRELAILLTDRVPTNSPSMLWPSLYRHLAHWPAFLGYASVLVLPRFAAIDAAAERLRARVDAAARELAAAMAPPAAIAMPAALQREQLQAAIGQFSRRIPEMVAIGAFLRAALPPVD